MKWKKLIKTCQRIAFNGSWSHRRNANQCLVDFINVEIGKVVDFDIESKIGRDKDPSEGSGRFKGINSSIIKSCCIGLQYRSEKS